MELVYMWIKDYGHLKNIGFNFEGKDLFQIKRTEIDRKGYTITYEMEITKKQNLYYINNFFNSIESKTNILNITAIIGENGVGKSTILEAIRTINTEANNGFFIIKKGNDYFRTKFLDSDKAKYKFSSIGFDLMPIDDAVQNSVLFSNFFKISYDNMYIEKHMSSISNLSTMSYLCKEENKQKNFETVLYEYNLEELSRQMDFITNFEKIIFDEFQFKIPSIITIIDSHPDKNQEDEKINKKIDEIIDKLKTNEMREYLEKIDFSKLIYEIYDFKRYDPPPYLPKMMINLFLQWFLNLINSNKSSNGYLIKSVTSYSGKPDNFLSFLQSLENEKLNLLLEILEVLVNIAYNYTKLLTPFRYTSSNYVYGNFEKDKDNFKKLVSLLKKSEYTSNLLQFKWREMSSGEMALLTLFSRFHSIKQLFNKEIVILLDEPDMYLHPKWVQKFISFFIEYLKLDFSDYKIQIIITSNKPIFTSDLPAHNVIRLIKTGIDEKTNWPTIEVNKNDSFQSFGANIYSLYKDGFFLNEGFMGMFAKKKIQTVIKWLNDKRFKKPNKKYEKTIIDIGDTIIKHKLTQMYNDKMEMNHYKDRINDKNF